MAAIRVAGLRGDPCGAVRCTEVNIVAVAYLVKNDHRIASRMIAESLNFPKTVVLRIWERESCVHVLFHTPRHLSKRKIFLSRPYRDGRCRQNFF